MSVRKLTLALLVVAGALAAPSPAAAATKGIFSVDCFYSHSLPDDPIVHPGEPGASHLHDFFGNTSADASSTEGSMRAAGTKCKDQDDDAGYWNPAGYLDGTRLAGRRIAAYYVNPTEGSVETIPAGLEMVGGSSEAGGPAENPNAFWFCGRAASPLKSHPYDCTGYDGDVTGVVKFPSCWNGNGLARTDVDYPNQDGTCPAGFGHRIVTLSYRVHLGIKDPCAGATPCEPADAPAENIALTLSSGEYWTLHADFWNTWNQDALNALVESCDNAHTNCGKVASSPTIPAAPTGPSAAAGGSVVNLSWNAPADGGSPVTGYTVYRGQGPGEETPLATIGPETTYQDTAVTNGTTYYYRVAASNDVGEGALSVEVSATPSEIVTPAAPTLAARTAYRAGVRISWKAPSDGGAPIVGYRIYKSRAAGQERLVLELGLVTHYRDEATRPGVRYYYRVAAVNEAGPGELSNEASAVAR